MSNPEDGTEFTVTWKIQLSARRPEDAARLALEMQRDYTSTAKVFTVQAEGGEPIEVDLHEGTIAYPAGKIVHAIHLTADGEPITLGGVYWDYDLRLSRVTHIAQHTEKNHNNGQFVAWHRTERVDGSGSGSFDGSRLAVRHPTTRQIAEEAAASISQPAERT